MIRLTHFFVSLALCSAPAIQSWAQKPDPQQLMRFMDRYREYNNAFARYQFSTSPATISNRSTYFWNAQLAAADASMMGRPNDALLYFPIVTAPPKSLPDPEHYRAADARQWIATQAPSYRIVMINEAHHVPQTRLLTLSLLKPLHDAGFRYLALEALVNNGKNPVAAGYPDMKTGEYTKEPIMADLVREALRLGYTLVPYETDDDEAMQIATRESGQARNLAAFLSKHPDAKLLLHAGYAHVAKTDAVTISGAHTMATELIAKTHVRVLSVDQTELTPVSKASQEAIDAQLRMAREFSVAGPVVFIQKNGGTPWSSKPGAYDANVLLPPSPGDVTRPDWMSLGGVRRKVYIDAIEACADQLPCLVTATPANEPREAIPADQFVVLIASEARSPLFLRDGVYHLRYTTKSGRLLFHRLLDVHDNPGGASVDHKP